MSKKQYRYIRADKYEGTCKRCGEKFKSWSKHHEFCLTCYRIIEARKDEAQQMSELSYVYVIGSSTNNAVKIGRSIDPVARLNQLQVAASGKLELLVAFACNKLLACRVERHLHGAYSKKRLEGEWFDLDNDELIDIVDFLRYQSKFLVFPKLPIKWVGTQTLSDLIDEALMEKINASQDSTQKCGICGVQLDQEMADLVFDDVPVCEYCAVQICGDERDLTNEQNVL